MHTLRTRTTILFIVLAVICFWYPAKVWGSDLHVDARAALLMDADTGQVYYAKNEDQPRSPASLTKLMTAIVATENGNLDDVVEISARAGSAAVGSTIGLNKGDRISLYNLLKAALITSANDATVAIGEHVGGHHDAFIQLMNRKAALLGAENTRFVNTNGYYDPNHYSTAYDLGLITWYALQNPHIAKLVATREDVVEWLEPARAKEVRNTNRLLRSGEMEGIDGVKTGSTPRAGDCLIASATRGDMRLIAVVLCAGNRYREATKLIEYGFAEVQPLVIFPAGRALGEAKVDKGLEAAVPVAFADPVRAKIARDQLQNIKMQIVLKDRVSAPIKEGQILGYALFTVNGHKLIKTSLVATREVVPANILARLLYWLTG